LDRERERYEGRAYFSSPVLNEMEGAAEAAAGASPLLEVAGRMGNGIRFETALREDDPAGDGCGAPCRA
jgi:hypothetical protein